MEEAQKGPSEVERTLKEENTKLQKELESSKVGRQLSRNDPKLANSADPDQAVPYLRSSLI